MLCWLTQEVRHRLELRFKVTLHSKMSFACCLLHLDVWSPLCRILCVQSLILEGCFHIQLLNGGESFSALTFNLIFMILCSQSESSMKLEASSSQTVRMDFSVKQKAFCVQELNFWSKQYVHIQIYLVYNFCGKNTSDPNYYSKHVWKTCLEGILNF